MLGQSLLIDGALTGLISDACPVSVLGLGIKSALTGSLTISGVTNTDGSIAAWNISPGSSGVQAAPGSGLASRLSYALSNSADLGKVFIAFRPI